MAAFRALERDETAASFDKDTADATVERMNCRLGKMKLLQEGLRHDMEGGKLVAEKHEKHPYVGGLLDFPCAKNRIESDELTQDQLDYAEQAGMIAKRARLAMVNRQIAELENAMKTIAANFRCADAQLMIAEDTLNSDDAAEEEIKEAQKLQSRVRDAKIRAKEAKTHQEELKKTAKHEEAERRAMVARKKREDELARKFAEEMGMGDVRRNKGIAGAAAKRMKLLGGKTIFGGSFENEQAAVEAAIKTRHTAKLGKVEAMVGLAFSVGAEETDAMTSKQVT